MNLRLHPFLGSVWVATFVLKCVVLAIVCLTQREQRPRFFLPYLSLRVLKTTALLILAIQPWNLAYGAVHWTGELLCHGLVIAIAVTGYAEMLKRRVTPIRNNYQARLWSGLPGLLVLVLVCSKLPPSGGTADWLTQLTTWCDQVATVWICGMFWILISFAEHFGIPKDSPIRAVAIGLAAVYTVALCTTTVRAHLTPGAVWWHWTLWAVDFAGEWFCYGVWFVHYGRMLKQTQRKETLWRELELR